MCLRPFLYKVICRWDDRELSRTGAAIATPDTFCRVSRALRYDTQPCRDKAWVPSSRRGQAKGKAIQGAASPEPLTGRFPSLRSPSQSKRSPKATKCCLTASLDSFPSDYGRGANHDQDLQQPQQVRPGAGRARPPGRLCRAARFSSARAQHALWSRARGCACRRWAGRGLASPARRRLQRRVLAGRGRPPRGHRTRCGLRRGDWRRRRQDA